MKLWLFTLTLFSGSLLANEAENNIPGVDPLSSGYLVKLTLGLVGIVLLIFALGWVMKKMQLTQFSQNGLIQIVSAISVGHRDRIALIQVGDEQVLVGLTPGRIHTLHTLKSPVAITAPAVAGTATFSDKFKQVLQQEKRK
ncbi:MAG: flagellar biosynthetic protein FliO [Gammaproteobacteria bacterium]|nr:flagellar biosynthetic protein FliO [Gammaproteobacteria bacterium]